MVWCGVPPDAATYLGERRGDDVALIENVVDEDVHLRTRRDVTQTSAEPKQKFSVPTSQGNQSEKKTPGD